MVGVQDAALPVVPTGDRVQAHNRNGVEELEMAACIGMWCAVTMGRWRCTNTACSTGKDEAWPRELEGPGHAAMHLRTG